jgi:hypothetical protein
MAKQPASAPHMLRIVTHTVPRVGRSNEHFPDGFELHQNVHISSPLAWLVQGSLESKDPHRPYCGHMLLGIGLL